MPIPTTPGRSRRASRVAAFALSAAGVLGAAVAGCGNDGLSSGPITVPPRAKGLPLKPSEVVDAATGLKKGDLWALDHLSAGSELLPLAFLLALDDVKTGKPFLNDPERFGLIVDREPSAESPVVLPVGLSVAPSRDLRFANVQMAGVSCGACHVGAVEAPGKPALKIAGAPGAFDASAFYRDLAASTEAVSASPSASWAFLGRLYRMYRYVPPPASAPGGGGGGGGGGGAGKGQAKGKAFAKKGGSEGAGQAKGKGQPKAKAKAKARVAPKSAPRTMFFGWTSSLQERVLLGAPASAIKGTEATGGLAGLPMLYPDLAELKDAGIAERGLAEALERLHQEELARPAPEFEATLVTAPPAGAKGPLADYLDALARRDETALSKFGPELTEASAALRMAMTGELPNPVLDVRAVAPASTEGATSNAYPVSAPLPTAAMADASPSALTDLLRDYVETVRLLRARVGFLNALGRDPGGSGANAGEPGPGRVDAVGRARGRLFPGGPDKASAAPVSFPQLWGVDRLEWSLWDASTTSALGRDAAHLLGAGGVPYKSDGSSTLSVSNLGRLESFVAALRPPAWPEGLFGKPDAAKAARGASLFAERCASCHAPAPADAKAKAADRLVSLDEVGTDPNRAREFARPVAGKAADAALGDALKGVVAKAGGESTASDRWRVTETYPARPLVAAWATAPYLHNGSVPTLHDLLLPEDQRPKTFTTGRREYDPKRLGFTTGGEKPGGWTFDTSRPGNSNKGHSGPKFGTDLSEPDREALLEYLKGS